MIKSCILYILLIEKILEGQCQSYFGEGRLLVPNCPASLDAK